MIDKNIELKLIKILKKYNRETDNEYDNLKQFYFEGLSGESFNKIFEERMKMRVCEIGNIMNEDFEKMCQEAYILGNGKQLRLLEVVKLAIEDRKMIVVDDFSKEKSDIQNPKILAIDVKDELDEDSDDGDLNDDLSIEDKILINKTKFKKKNNAQNQKDVTEFFANSNDRLKDIYGNYLTWKDEIKLFWYNKKYYD